MGTHDSGPKLEAQAPEFQPLSPEAVGEREAEPIGFDPLLEVTVTVAVELGRARMCLGDVARLKPGAVVVLDRVVTEPVELVAQGLPIARGEVVVVDDQFAIRITELLDPRRRAGAPK
jgi:flagellar motor switch protein FliN/FliY